MGARVLILALLALAGCLKKSKLYCEMHATDLENCGYLDAGIDARPTCAGDPDCASSPGAPYCELGTGFCVECYLPEHCAANPEKKFCDLETFRCASCREHADCTSAVCLDTGVCGDDSNVAYVDPMADPANMQCTFAAKCQTIADALATMRPYIKLQGAIVEPVDLSDRMVTFLAEPGTTWSRSNGGVVLKITAGSEVSAYDVTILGMGDQGISVESGSTARLTHITVTGCNTKDKPAIDVLDSTLVLTQSTLVGNLGGGLRTDAMTTFNVTNTFLVRNGKTDGMFGGAKLGATTSGVNKFEMNTIVDNIAGTGNVAGLFCAGAVPAPNNIIARNVAGAAVTTPANVPALGGCTTTGSIILDDVTNLRFKMPDGTGPWDYHIDPGSMAIDGIATSSIANDVDGDARPYNMRYDVGADEYTPP